VQHRCADVDCTGALDAKDEIPAVRRDGPGTDEDPAIGYDSPDGNDTVWCRTRMNTDDLGASDGGEDIGREPRGRSGGDHVL